ncbi:MAG TPA: SUF system NifU family Fe-S cluster assembly protein [Planctomycetota bacterium]|nr:SUF system NifU family Fe-S cluster assembly protein [Planctomycetota bacterium]
MNGEDPIGSLSELYQEVILDHYRKPRNFGMLRGADRKAEGHNPLCGDRIALQVRTKDDVIDDIRFEGKGCAISTASASMMTEAVKGKSRAEAEALFEKFHALVRGGGNGKSGLGKLEAFGGVGEFPLRVKCATLAWHTLKAALDGSGETISTE